MARAIDRSVTARNLLARLLIDAAALFVADALVAGIAINGWQSYAVMVVVFALVNAFAKPVLKLLTCPLIILTLGLFLLVINAAMFGVAAAVSDAVGADVRVDGFGAALAGALVVSIVGWLLSIALD
jgi:putative membrane protein